jgi:hypothetical protein
MPTGGGAPRLGAADEGSARKIAEDAMNEQAPLPYGVAARAEARCVLRTVALLAQRRIHQPSQHVGLCLRFADGTAARVYRETVVDAGVAQDPCLLLVAFRLRLVRGRGHTLFRWESELNTPLFVGYPGFASKLWLAHDQRGVYRGLYEWDGAERAESYARCLWRVLALSCVPSSIHYRVVPGLRRDEVLAAPELLAEAAPEDEETWWRLAAVA